MSASIFVCARAFSSGESCGEICGASGFVGSGSGSVVVIARRAAGGRGGLLNALDICGAQYGNAGEVTSGGVESISRTGIRGGLVTPVRVNFALTGFFGQPPNPITAK